MAEQVRWGVTGSGGIARRRTIPEGIAAARNAVLSAVYDANAAVNAQVAAQYGARAASGMEDLLGEDVDAVYIASPTEAHYGQALAACAAGKHVLCEKPLGLSVGEAESMVAAAARAGVRFATAFMMRFQSQHQEALRIIRAGGLGQPVYARAQLSCWYPPIEGAWRQDLSRSGGGSLIDMGGHLIDLLEMLWGPVKQVSCFVGNAVHAYQPEDSAVALLAFENGAFGTVDAFFCIPDRAVDNVLELYGSKGSILAKGTIGQGEYGEMTARLEESAAGYDARQQRIAGRGTPVSPPPVNPYRAEIEEFSEAILTGRESCIPGELGVRSQRLLAACYESARTLRAVLV